MEAAFELTFNHAAQLPFGLPEDRLARLAARRAFVEMKTCFVNAVADIPGATGAMLQDKVRMASEVVELWRLHRAVLAALPAHAHSHRRELMLQIDSAFPEVTTTAFLPL